MSGSIQCAPVKRGIVRDSWLVQRPRGALTSRREKRRRAHLEGIRYRRIGIPIQRLPRWEICRPGVPRTFLPGAALSSDPWIEPAKPDPNSPPACWASLSLILIPLSIQQSAPCSSSRRIRLSLPFATALTKRARILTASVAISQGQRRNFQKIPLRSCLTKSFRIPLPSGGLTNLTGARSRLREFSRRSASR